jgi:hypothetical protein
MQVKGLASKINKHQPNRETFHVHGLKDALIARDPHIDLDSDGHFIYDHAGPGGHRGQITFSHTTG